MRYLDPWATQTQGRKHGRHPESRAAQSPRMRLEGSLDPEGIFRSQVKAVRRNSYRGEKVEDVEAMTGENLRSTCEEVGELAAKGYRAEKDLEVCKTKKEESLSPLGGETGSCGVFLESSSALGAGLILRSYWARN